jgi:phosphoribosyl 1,2-cyclic phosphate phosphodiesterase
MEDSRVIILGCGSSCGVPMIGCNCAVCSSSEIKNKRFRSSILFQDKDHTILVDTSPDLRQQALINNIKNLDAVIYTHAHADHVNGIDDLKTFSYNSSSIPVYADSITLASIQASFSYAFSAYTLPGGITKSPLTAQVIEYGKTFLIGAVKVTPFAQEHGKIYSTGLRFDRFAYSTDLNALSDEAFEILEGVPLWIVDCLSVKSSFSHSHLELTLKWIERVKPKKAILTHMSHNLDYFQLKKILPDNVEPAFDGMIIAI